MYRFLFAALAAATIFSGGALGSRAEAMTLATRSALGIATADAALVQQATNVCGSNGCVRVQTSGPRKRPHGTHHP